MYGIVTQSGGSITVRSELGKGARFAAYFPEVAAEATTPAIGEAPIGAVGGPETVLVVEDDSAVRAGIRGILTGAGHRVIEAADGHDALRRLEAAAGAVHVVVTDLVMPLMSGLELARRVRALRPALPVLFISGYAPPADAPFGPGETFLPKPFDAPALLRCVRHALDDAAARAAGC